MITFILLFTLKFVDQDYDNSWNHLLFAKHANYGNLNISYSSVQKLPLEEGSVFWGRVNAECSANGKAYYPDQSDDKWDLVTICDAVSVEVLK